VKPFYWIDSFQGYPAGMDVPIQTSIDTYNGLYSRYTEALGYELCLVDLEDVHISTGAIWYESRGNLLTEEGAAYIGLVHPDPQRERKQESLYRLIAESPNLRLLNHLPKYPMVCKDKFGGVYLARQLGLATLPTALLGTGLDTLAQRNIAEKAIGGYPMFIRPRDLTAGLGKKVVNDREELERYLENPPFPQRMYIIQPHIEVETEYRVYLDGQRIIACRKREALEQGGSCATPSTIREGSRALAAYLESTYLCVDWICDGNDFWFCEFEVGGGFSELDAMDRDRVAAAFFRRLSG
jgi:hypothetical protein